MLGISGHEFVIILLVIAVVIGPSRLPEYTRQLMGWVRKVRDWVEDSRGTLEGEMGITVDELKKYDPRQYDPRRIIREAWGGTDPKDLFPDTKDLLPGDLGASSKSSSTTSAASSSSKKKDDKPKGTPFDDEAT